MIQPSDSFEPRRKVVLREEDNAWTPVLGSFDKLRELGVSSYLFYSWFKCFVDVSVGLCKTREISISGKMVKS